MANKKLIEEYIKYLLEYEINLPTGPGESRHDYFKRRLKKLGMYDEGSDYDGMIGKAIEELSDTFSKQGHSGFSAQVTMQLFNKLMGEWTDGKLEERIQDPAARELVMAAYKTQKEKAKSDPMLAHQNLYNIAVKNKQALAGYRGIPKTKQDIEKLSDLRAIGKVFLHMSTKVLPKTKIN